MRAIMAAVLGIALVGCAAKPFPAMRPLTEAHITTMGATNVVIVENNNGIEKSWFYTSTASAGAAYGLIGALVSAAMDAIINAGPSRRAQKAADEMAELISVDELNASLAEQFRLQMPGAQAVVTAVSGEAVVADAATVDVAAEAVAADAAVLADGAVVPVAITEPAPLPSGVHYSDVSLVQRLTSPMTNDTIEIATQYTLSEDSSTLRVIATVSYQNPQTPYRTPYDFGGSVPRSETGGPAYRNTFTYYSSQLPVPTLTPELRERLIASIQDSARSESGQLPAANTDEFRAMNSELEKARDNTLTKDEIAIFLTREWLREDGARLRQEIAQAHAYIARYVLLDLNRAAVPSLTGTDELLETVADNRTVRRVGVGVGAGSYISSAGNVSSFSTYGNTIGISRANRTRMDNIRNRRTAAIQ
jgi:hypothetical protein